MRRILPANPDEHVAWTVQNAVGRLLTAVTDKGDAVAWRTLHVRVESVEIEGEDRDTVLVRVDTVEAD
jgi:predicted regulator of Ras-like GTPase activity (Roadblock/LC7/MglB family)